MKTIKMECTKLANMAHLVKKTKQALTHKY